MMRWWLHSLGFFLLAYLINGKPVKLKGQQTELVREKRSDVEEEDPGTNEMQTFMLDLSTKDDMQRLRERFKNGQKRNVENDEEYRRLRRFSVRDEQKENSPSGSVTMEMRSSRRMREDEDVTNSESSSSENLKKTTVSDKNSYSSFSTEQKRSTSLLAKTISKRSTNKRDNQPAAEDKSGSKSLPENSDSTGIPEHLDEIEDSEIFEKNSIPEPSEADGIEDTGGYDENIAVDKRSMAHVNYHIAGDTWELIHHDPNTGSLPSFLNSNTTIHSKRETRMLNKGITIVRDNVRNDISDDEHEYKKLEKSRRKPRLSEIRIVRAIEPEYEVQDISAVYNGQLDSPDEEAAHVIEVNKKPIKSDGYIGCFIDQHPNRDLIKSFSVNDLTPDSCRLVCKEKGHAYTGVQYGYLCHCGDDYGKYGHATEDQCNSVCRGDEHQKCGGFWRNSVYATDIFGENRELETRSQIDRVIPLPETENEEIPVQQDMTFYLRADIPKPVAQLTPPNAANYYAAMGPYASYRPNILSKKTYIPSPTQSLGPENTNQQAYLHPQHIPRSFIPSKIMLKTFQPLPGKRTYIGTVKLKQNWHDNLKDINSPKTMILAGNIESALSMMFDADGDFEKAEVLGFREATIRNNPNSIHKVLVEFALTFKNMAVGKDKKLCEIVENSNKLDDMPVFGYTIQVKEYSTGKDISKQSDVHKERRKARSHSHFEDKDTVDPFLEKVFSQI